MGFTTGLLGGATLTTSIIYLSLHAHHSNRMQQALILRQQTLVLNHIIDPEPPTLPPTSREVRGGALETAKDRWNKEIELLVRRAASTDWGLLRERAEQGLVSGWRRLQGQVDEVNKSL